MNKNMILILCRDVSKMNYVHCRRGMLLAWGTIISNEYNLGDDMMISCNVCFSTIIFYDLVLMFLVLLTRVLVFVLCKINVGDKEVYKIRGKRYRGIGSKISQETWETTLVPRDTSLGRFTVDVNAHESAHVTNYIFLNGLVARIRRSHRRGRGSIPRWGKHFVKMLASLLSKSVRHYFDESVKSEDIKGRLTQIGNDKSVIPKFLSANLDDNYTEFSFENNDQSDFLLLTKELEST
ncbi:hypothetical protein PHYBLDRAFT_172417 [Phycomyces blakesleeanus NRRL 1555(-)]|uniref:Uncharacterized protein n=1 Tax=Phycomyces blakesleeanus (strain ATCC 8743b / DSM 1359 / FGSC 10004 / NBRC 33097 / NRRL 1555) TaxID=763407 RepID=A0A162ZUU1_PHYB8|nr:hypothetical protein PHYBLDRAFT_172417 [Phycomyces blakesleeanus NRRL 1555(-)]OAD69161.1 hypothetical protein PHYBLDRAFT_172417 [Phycomyces blakesleeanus NRRL 1555(-)]|eukprot:XP_018287201.1 hypothetical protein PHYBLDRAFT_172417 [Phycomyces blakesleeanus NRRL 1555(-)]